MIRLCAAASNFGRTVLLHGRSMRELHCGQTGVFALSGFVLRCAIAMGSICVGSGMSPNGWVKSRWGEKVFVYKGLVEPHCASSNYIHVCVWRSFVMQLTRVGHEGQMISNLFRGSRVLMAFHAMGFIYTKGIADSILCALFLNSQKVERSRVREATLLSNSLRHGSWLLWFRIMNIWPAHLKNAEERWICVW